jgi:hypothetical protein
MVIVIIFFYVYAELFFTLHQTHERAPAEKIYLHKFQAKFFSFFSVRGFEAAAVWAFSARSCFSCFLCRAALGGGDGFSFFSPPSSFYSFQAIMMLLERGGCKFYGNRRAELRRQQEEAAEMGK